MSAGVQLSGLTVTLPGSGTVLESVDLTVAPGEIVAVIGASGAGKSVLARTLLGLTQDVRHASVRATAFTIDGVDVRTASRRQWRALRGTSISLVLQDAMQSLDPLRTVHAEVAETPEVHRAPRPHAPRIVASLEDAGFPAERSRAHVYELSGGLRQRALIASALSGMEPGGGAGIIVADEPTTALDAMTARRLLAQLRAMRDAGRGILLITHDLGSVARIADRILILDAGRVVETGTTDTVLADPQHAATRALRAAIVEGPNPAPVDPAVATDQLLTATEITKVFRGRATRPVTALEDVTFDLRRGETLGVVGESGSGKSTLVRTLFDLERPDSGSAVWASPQPRVRFVPQDPLGSFDPRHRVGRILRDAAAATSPDIAALLRSVGLPPDTARRRPATLSGGQRQRVAIARALAADPDVLVCDEPVSALDVVTQAEVLGLLRRLKTARGLTVVFVSHDLAVVRAVSDRVLVLRDGRVIETGPTETVWADPQQQYTRDLVETAR